MIVEHKPYVYEVIDKVTGKYYVGSRTAKGCHPEELGISYFTSSKVVSAIFKLDPNRFEKRILVSGDTDYVVKVESDILRFRDSKNDVNSYNIWNGAHGFNPVKAAEVTVTLKLGVHARSQEKKRQDAKKGGLQGGKITRNKGVGIFARTIEEMKKAGSHAGKTQSRQVKINNGKKTGAWAKLNKVGFCGMTHQQRSNNGLKTSSKRFECLECGMVSTAGGIEIHQRASLHSGRKHVN